MKYSCHYIIHLGCLMGFTMYFYIIFGTNQLTGGLVQLQFFLPISVFHKKVISNGVQTEWNLRKSYFWKESNTGDLECMSGDQRGEHEAGGRALHPRGPSVAPPTYFFLLYKSTYPPNIQKHHENLIPPPQLLYSRNPISGPFPELRRRGHWSRRASTSTPWPLRWCVSSLLHTFGSIASS